MYCRAHESHDPNVMSHGSHMTIIVMSCDSLPAGELVSVKLKFSDSEGSGHIVHRVPIVNIELSLCLSLQCL